jgi:hypothetical protein
MSATPRPPSGDVPSPQYTHREEQEEADKQLRRLFTYHAPKEDQPERYAAIRQSAYEFAQVVMECCPNSADRSAALRKIREAMFTSNAAIALEE